MGQVLYQSMTRKEEDINAWSINTLPSNEVRAIPYLRPDRMPQVMTPHSPLQNDNINMENAVIPFKPQFQDQEVPDFDLVSILDDMEKENKRNENIVAVVSTNTNVLNNVLKSMFSNCTIQK